MTRRLAPLLLSVLAAACRRPTPPPAAPPPPPPGFDVTALPRTGTPEIAGRAAGGALQVTSGAWRAVVSPRGEVRWSEDAMPGRIVDARPVARGWAFVTLEGVVAGSDDFLGPLRRLGELPRGLARVEGSATPFWVVAGGRIWSLEAGGAPAPLAQPAGDVLDARLADGGVGFALLDGGTLVRTADAGRSWAPVDLGARVPIAFERGLRVATTDGLQALAPDGSIAPTEWTLPPPPAAADAALLQVVEREGERRMAVLSGVPWLRGPNGTVFVAHELVAVEPATGRAVRDLTAELPAPGCYAQDWGPSIALVCPDHQVYRLTAQWHFEPAFRVDGSAATLILSDDGRGAATSGDGCPLCALDPATGEWRRLPVDAAGAYGSSMSGDRVATVSKGKLVLARAGGGPVEEVTLEPRPGEWRLSRCRSRDGTLVMTARPRGGRTAVAVRAPDGRVVYGALPAEIRPIFGPEVCFLDAKHGFAVGMSYLDFATTDDGGAHWTSLAGRNPWLDAEMWPYGSMGDSTFHTDCDADVCAVNLWSDLLLFGAGRFPRARVVAPHSARPPAEDLLRARSPDDAGLHLACAPSGPAQPAAAPAPGRRFANAIASGAVVDLPRGRVELRWTVNGRAFSTGPVGRPRPGLLEPLGATAAREVLTPLVAGPDLLALLRCELHPYHQCLVVLARKGRLSHELDFELFGTSGSDYTLQAVLPASSGALLQLRGRESNEGHVDVLLALGADGRVQARRTMFWARRHDLFERHTVLARHRGQPGLAVQDREAEDRWRFLPWPAGPPIDLPPVRVRGAAPCAGAAAPTELHLPLGGPDRRPDPALELEGLAEGVIGEAILEVAEDGTTCWREIAVPFASAKPGDSAGTVRIAGGADGLAGERDDGRHRQPLVCRMRSGQSGSRP